MESNYKEQSATNYRLNFSKNLNYFFICVALTLMVMSPFLFIFFVSLISPFVSRKLVLIFSPFVLLFIICFYASLQPFSDLAEYMNVYHQIYAGSIDVFGYERFGYGIEFIILLIMKVTGIISAGNDQFFIFSIYAIIFSILYFMAIKIDKRFHLIILVSFFASLGFVESLSYFLRQNLSVLFFLYGLLAVRNKKLRYIFFLLSFFSHFSALINIFVYFFATKYARRIDNPQRIAKVALIVAVMILLVVAFLFTVPSGKVLYDKMVYVVNNNQYSPLPTPYVLFTVFNTLFILAFSYRFRQSNIVIYYLMIKEIAFFFLTLPFPAVPNRLGMLIFSYAYLFLLSMYTIPLSMRKKYIISILFLTMNAFPFLYSMYIVSMKGNDLSFYMNKPLTISSLELADGFYHNFRYGVKYLDGGNNL